MEAISLLPVPAQHFSVTLDKQACTINLFTRLDNLYMDLAIDDAAIWYGRICLAGVPMKLYRYEKFKGQLLFVSTDGSDPQASGLGTIHSLVYASQAELEELR